MILRPTASDVARHGRAMHRRGNRGPLGRRVGGGGGGAAPAPVPPGSPVLWWRGAGVTGVAGDVATWDSEGSNALRLQQTDPALRPLVVTVGSLTAVQFDGSTEYMVSASAFQAIEPYVSVMVMRQDTGVANRRIIDYDTAAYGAYNASGNGIRFEQGATDQDTTTAKSNGDFYWWGVKIAAGTGGTSRMFLDGVQEDSAAGTAAAPASRTIGLGATNAGVNPSALTVLAVLHYHFADNTELEAFDMSASGELATYCDYLIAQAGG